MMGWRKNADIGLCTALMILFATSVLYLPDGNAIRFASAVPALFFIPGYLFLSLLWPRGDMPLEERIAMSIAMSLIVDVAAGLSLSVLAYISLTTVMITLLTSVTLMMIITIYLRSRYAPDKKDEKEGDGNGKEKIDGHRDREEDRDHGRSIAARIPMVLLIFALIAASAAVIPYYNQGTEIDNGFSNLYLLDENHTADNLPKEINQSTEIIVGVKCMEEGGSDYRLHIWFSNETSKNNNSINITLEEKNFTLQHGENREINLTISPEKLMTMVAGVNETSPSNISTCFHGTYRIGASLDIGQDGTVDNTVWLWVSINEG